MSSLKNWYLTDFTISCNYTFVSVRTFYFGANERYRINEKSKGFLGNNRKLEFIAYEKAEKYRN